jgi:hypothetical protein
MMEIFFYEAEAEIKPISFHGATAVGVWRDERADASLDDLPSERELPSSSIQVK